MARAKKPRSHAGLRKGKRTAPRFYGPGELDDLALLPGEFRALRRDTKYGFEMLANKIMPSLDEIKASNVELRARVADHETRLAALEAERKGNPP